MLEDVLSGEGDGAWSPTLQRQITAELSQVIDPAVSATVDTTNRECVACTEEVTNEQAIHFISGCNHVMCVSCAIGYVRANMETATPELYPFRCPAFCTEDCPGHMVDISYLQLLAPELLDDGITALSMEEVQRYNQQQVFAAIPAHQRIRCPHPTCGALLFNPNGQASDTTQAEDATPEPERMRCSHCERFLCQTCTEVWGEQHLCPALRKQREEQERLSLAEVARLLEEQQQQEAEEEARAETQRQMQEVAERQRRLEEQRQRQQAQIAESEQLITATSKPCPRCRAPITHFRGHACHHITPGGSAGGCSACHHQFCYMCLAPWHTCRCPLFCTTACDCPPCPTCRPGRGCADCDSDGRCPSCSG